jgi:putative spermidine/putrescine transport system permease protein
VTWRTAILGAVAASIAVFLLAPMLIIISMSFSASNELTFPPRGLSLRWYDNFFTSDKWTAAMLTSLQVSLLTTAVATIVGTATGIGLVRARFWGKSLVNGFMLAPLIVPVVVIAIGMFFVFSSFHLTGSLPGLVLAQSVLAVPFVVVNVAVSARTVDRNLELAAQNLGANPWRTFRHVTLPLIAPGIVAGALFAFIASWDEVVVAIFLSSATVRTLPVLMWSEVRTKIDPTIAAVATMLMLVTTVSLLLILVLRHRATRPAT